MSGTGLRDRKKQQTWDALRAAGLRLAAQRGIENVSVDEIAAAVNVSKRTLFNYFASKEDLLFGPDPAEPDRIAEIVRDRPAGEPLWTSLREIVLGYATAHEAKLRLKKQVVAASTAALSDVSAAAGAVLEEALVACVAARGRTDRMHELLLARSAMTVLRTAFATWHPDEDYGRFTDHIRYGFDLLGAGLIGEASPRTSEGI